MIRRSFLQTLAALGALEPLRALAQPAAPAAAQARGERAYWVATLTRMVRPVLTNLAAGQLRARMPVEVKPGAESRADVAHLEAFGRTMAGLAPWLALGPDNTAEGRTRAEYIELARTALVNAVYPRSPDYMNWNRGTQPLVDAAFLAHALVRAPAVLCEGLDTATHRNLVEALQATRVIVPYYSNWLLFSAMVEVALLRLDAQWDATRVDLVIRRLEEWYVGDGTYGDGPEYHWDYYNSFVIQPFLLDILGAVRERQARYGELYQRQLEIARRYATVQERLIAPDGTFPVIGRSLAYRFGAFQLLAQVALMDALPEALPPAQVRTALTAVIRRVMAAPDTYDRDGWLRIGLSGSQPDIAEAYISTGSLYLATTVFLPLGLPAGAPFWTGAPRRWTAQRAWSGEAVPADHALSLPPLPAT
ncbi:MAG: DUF2264 domain-containing protein [Gemmatimonadetes bacterium]|nr:DUF2264 domain-containing protein [Gemmatimonadota bacterium]